MPRSFSTEAIVLSRRNYSESHRFITLFSKDHGKLTGLANGVRKLTSRKRASLEPANHVKLHFARSKSIPIITQSELLCSFPHSKKTLTRITQTYQILEIIDKLTVEDQPHPTIYHQLVNLLHQLQTDLNQKDAILQTTKLVLSELGFGLPSSDSESALKLHIEEITSHPLRSKPFLTPSLT